MEGRLAKPPVPDLVRTGLPTLTLRPTHLGLLPGPTDSRKTARIVVGLWTTTRRAEESCVVDQELAQQG